MQHLFTKEFLSSNTRIFWKKYLTRETETKRTRVLAKSWEIINNYTNCTKKIDTFVIPVQVLQIAQLLAKTFWKIESVNKAFFFWYWQRLKKFFF